MEERIQKVLARMAGVSRRKAEELVKAGRVKLDGQVVTEMGVRVDPGRQSLLLDGKPIRGEERKLCLLLNKPKGYLSTLHDPQGRPIITDILKGISERVFPVGRLDLDTEGALLLTNDGLLAQYVQHPRYGVNKTYVALVAGCPKPEDLDRLEHGIEIEGRTTWPAQLKVLRRGKGSCLLRITIHEGRKHQIKKMLAAVGHPVLSLKRTAYGGLELGSLPLGKYRLLTVRDLGLLFSGKNNLYKAVCAGLV